MARVSDHLKLLAPCLALREVQLQHAKSEARVARQYLDGAQVEADTARGRSYHAQVVVTQLVASNQSFGALELVSLRAAIRALSDEVIRTELTLDAAQRQMEERRVAVSSADATLRTLTADVEQLRRRAARLNDEKSLALSEDLWSSRRKKQ
jgi:hypothetical protein